MKILSITTTERNSHYKEVFPNIEFEIIPGDSYNLKFKLLGDDVPNKFRVNPKDEYEDRSFGVKIHPDHLDNFEVLKKYNPRLKLEDMKQYFEIKPEILTAVKNMKPEEISTFLGIDNISDWAVSGDVVVNYRVKIGTSYTINIEDHPNARRNEKVILLNKINELKTLTRS